jgi:hypothetical protein
MRKALIMISMKYKMKYLLVPAALLLTSCAFSPVALAPVGPNPASAGATLRDIGYLRVFSDRDLVTEGYDGGNPSYYQHSPYRIYDSHGKFVRYVGNTVGEYATAPAVVSLRPGSYVVLARAKDYLTVKVPVLIVSGRSTNVHLDDRWRPPTGTPNDELVLEPSGSPVGWHSRTS